MTEHLEVRELQERRGLEVHIVGPDFFATFFYRVLDVFFLGAFMVSQAADEIVEGFFEPTTSISRLFERVLRKVRVYILTAPQSLRGSEIQGYRSGRGGVGG